ncbi:adenylate kinase [Botrimarina hoheduenensis]|nr:adenylate kinase [Botrimarina hoheduenensis]
MRIVFIGPPGAGKGTQSVRVAKSLGVTHLSTGDVLRKSRSDGEDVGLAAAKYLDSGQLVPDDLVLQLVSERLQDDDCVAGYLFDGFPRTRAQAVSLDALLADRGTPLTAAIEFVVPRDELLRRLSKRGRADDVEETIRERLRGYEELTTPLSDYYQQRGVLGRIDAVGAEDEVFARVNESIKAIVAQHRTGAVSG